MPPGTGGSGARVWLLGGSAGPQAPVWGLTSEERLRRMLRRFASAGKTRAHAPESLIVRSDYVIDERLVHALLRSVDTVLVTGDSAGRSAARAVAAHVQADKREAALRLLRAETCPPDPETRCLRIVSAAQLAPSYDSALRKSETPLLLRAEPDSIPEIESRLFAASYKGVTDLVTKWLWPRPARAVTRLLARYGVRPNAVTAFSWILVGLATWLFAEGRFGVGLVAAWLMTFLDTVDGKLARVTLTSSRTGQVMDHGLDLVHPPIWYLAWAVGLPEGVSALAAVTWIVVGGYVAGRLLEGVFLLAFGIETHSWRPIDSRFRTVTARRNPNLILLTLFTLAGRADVALVAVAVWTAISLAFHALRLLQACAVRLRGRAIRPWYDSGAAAAGFGALPGERGIAA